MALAALLIAFVAMPAATKVWNSTETGECNTPPY